MSLRDDLKKISPAKLHDIARLCGGTALLIAVAISINVTAARGGIFAGVAPFANTAAVFNSSGTYTVPAGVTQIWVTVVGGGGGAGGGAFTGDYGGAGGGGSGGAVVNQYIAVTPGQQFSFVVGKGGAGGAGGCYIGACPGGTGGNSSFNGSIVATGGGGSTNGPAGSLGGQGSGGTPDGVPGQPTTWYQCFATSGGQNGTGYGSGGNYPNGCLQKGGNGQDGEVFVNDQPVAISASPQSLPSGGSSKITYTATSVDPDSCSVTGPGGSIIYQPPTPPPIVQTSSPASYWKNIASSQTGQYLIAVASYSSSQGGLTTASSGGVYTSNNYGLTWNLETALPTGVGWNLSAISAGGGRAVVGYSSSDLYIGTYSNGSWTWTPQTALGSKYWTGVVMSPDGSKIFASVSGAGVGYWMGIYNASSGTYTWSNQPFSGNAYALTYAATSNNLIIATYNSSIQIGTYAGGAWTWSTQTPPGITYTTRVAASPDGTRIAVMGDAPDGGTICSQYSCSATYGVYLWTGALSGGTWTWSKQPALGEAVSGLSFSNNGTLAVNTESYPYSSGNGAIWTGVYNGSWTLTKSTYGSNNWQAVAFSGDGTKLAAVTGLSNIYEGYVYAIGNQGTNLNSSYNATIITPPATYTISCTINGTPVSAQTTITSGSAVPTATLTGNGQSGSITVSPGQEVDLLATFSPAGSYTGSAINDSNQNALTSQVASSPKTYVFNSSSNHAAVGSYLFTAVVETSALGWANSFGQTFTVNVATSCQNGTGLNGSCTACNSGFNLVGGYCVAQCPANCPGPGAPSCTPNSGYSYNSINNTCTLTPSCPANCPGTYPACTPNSGYSYNSSNNSCTVALPSLGSFSPTPTRVQKGGTTELTWTGNNLPSTCTLSSTSAVAQDGSVSSGSSGGNLPNVGPINQATQFTLTCGSASAQTTVGIVPQEKEL